MLLRTTGKDERDKEHYQRQKERKNTFFHKVSFFNINYTTLALKTS